MLTANRKPLTSSGLVAPNLQATILEKIYYQQLLLCISTEFLTLFGCLKLKLRRKFHTFKKHGRHVESVSFELTCKQSCKQSN